MFINWLLSVGQYDKCKMVILRGSHHGGHGGSSFITHTVYHHAIVQLLSWRWQLHGCVEYLICLVTCESLMLGFWKKWTLRESLKNFPSLIPTLQPLWMLAHHFQAHEISSTATARNGNHQSVSLDIPMNLCCWRVCCFCCDKLITGKNNRPGLGLKAVQDQFLRSWFWDTWSWSWSAWSWSWSWHLWFWSCIGLGWHGLVNISD